ncbi:MAG: methyltransferase domain-containing protein [Candidatus Pacearchaeota archaeon]
MGIKNKISRYIERNTIKNLNKEITNYVKGRNVLDNGCNKGSFIYEKHKDKEIYATDINDSKEIVIKRGAKEFKKADSERIPYKKETFDCVVFAGVIQYIKDYDKALEEIKRVLKKDGRLIITTVNKGSIFRKIGLINPNPKKEAGEYQILNINELAKILKNRGFKIERFVGVDFTKWIPGKLRSNTVFICKKP